MIWQQLHEHLTESNAKLDRAITAWIAGYSLVGGRIFCGKGCSGCCTLAVNCSFIEAVSISRGLTGSTAELHNHVTRLLENIHSANDFKSYLQLQRTVIGPCPFLDKTGSCSIYPRRPLSCRALIATKESRWCSMNFGELSPLEKQQFIASLDRSVVALPMHYAAMPQEMGRELEAGTTNHMAEQFGFAIYGNMPFLVWLEVEHNLSELIPRGREAIADFLARKELDSQFLISIST